MGKYFGFDKGDKSVMQMYDFVLIFGISSTVKPYTWKESVIISIQRNSGGIIYIGQLLAGRFESSGENFNVTIQAVLYNVGSFNWILCDRAIEKIFHYFDTKHLQFCYVELRWVHSDNG